LCQKIEPQQFTLSPGEVRAVRVVIDLTAKQRPSEDAAFIVATTLQGEGQTTRPGPWWILKGRARPPLRFDQPPTFGRRSVLDQPLPPAAVTVIAAVPLSGLEVKSSNPLFRATARPDPSDQARYRVEVTATAVLPVGPIESEVVFRPTRETGELLPATRVRVTGRVERDVEVLPPSAPGGGREVGTVYEQTVTLGSLSGRQFKVIDMKAAGEGLSVRLSGSEYLIRQECGRVGPQTGRVEFFVDAADGAYSVPVEVTYVGIPTAERP
jgi:hypothetical protein